MNNFKNSSPIDFTIESERNDFAKCIKDFAKKVESLPIKIKPIINGEFISTKEQRELSSPNDPRVSLSKTSYADTNLCDDALKSLKKAQQYWNKTSLNFRAEILRKTATIMQKRQKELSAIIVYESGKNWYEADRDVIEAIDFCNYYAELAENSLKNFTTQNLPGETNLYTYESYGTALIISPWNFPLAIPCGMLVAALVSGNVAILKPAEQSNIIAFELVKILFEAGLPENVLAFLPGNGKLIGDYLVNSNDVQLICFTGSLGVGKSILKASTNLDTGNFIKKTILELGGKNAIIVDEDADLDEVIKGVLYSAFAFAGQKCSACSRLIVIGTAYDRLCERLASAVKDLIVAPSYLPESFLGPVIDLTSQQRILKIIANAEEKYNVIASSKTYSTGYFVPATLVTDFPDTESLWTDEIFGPVLAIKAAKDLTEAINLVNASKFALTGGLYSRSPKNIETIKSRLRVGNLYINRSCTGAIVGRQPFGGFKLSGIGSKAGGPDYLKQFVVPKVITENTMRRGFSPDIG